MLALVLQRWDGGSLGCVATALDDEDDRQEAVVGGRNTILDGGPSRARKIAKAADEMGVFDVQE